MTEVKRGALQSPADTARTTDTIVRHVQSIDASGEVVGGGSTPFDNEEIDVLNIALGLTAGTYLDATRAVIALEDGRIRIWVDGSDPTTTVGMIVEIGNIITLRSAAEIAGFKTIWMGAAAKLMVQYYH